MTVGSGAAAASFTVSSGPNLADQSGTLTASWKGVVRSNAFSLLGIKPVSITCAPATIKVGASAMCQMQLNALYPVAPIAIPLTTVSQYLKVFSDTSTVDSAVVSFPVYAIRATAQTSGSVSTAFNGASAAVTLIVVP